MRDYIIGAILLSALIGAGYYAGTVGRSDYDKLPHADWYCSDVRIDSLSLPLTPECWEYKRKDSHQNAHKGTANAKE